MSESMLRSTRVGKPRNISLASHIFCGLSSLERVSLLSDHLSDNLIESQIGVPRGKGCQASVEDSIRKPSWTNDIVPISANLIKNWRNGDLGWQ